MTHEEALMARLAKMCMDINQARQNFFARSIDDFMFA